MRSFTFQEAPQQTFDPDPAKAIETDGLAEVSKAFSLAGNLI